MLQPKPHLISPAEYLVAENTSPGRSEYVAGEVYAMTGGTLRHNRIALNLGASLLAALRGRPCAVFINDVKLHVVRADAFYYPDVMARCADTPLPGDVQVVDDPLLVIEVLSPTTETIDRREKLAAYRQIPSLIEYVLVAQEARSVEIYRRQGEIGWMYLAATGDETVSLTSVGVDLSLTALYAGTDTP